MNYLKQKLGNFLSRYLSEPGKTAGTAEPTRMDLLGRVAQTGDVLLVEGTSRVSSAIKYLTQSTWSHAALYVGKSSAGECQFLEADMVNGVRLVPLSHFKGFHCRICRPASLNEEERQAVCDFATARLGLQYDMKNIFDLARYLLPNPPIPRRWRRQMLSLGSGDPTRAICSTLVAEAFQSVRYPILPTIEKLPDSERIDNHIDISVKSNKQLVARTKALLHIRHHSLFVPRDFDVSPYFQVIKPTLAVGFDHHQLVWAPPSQE